MTLSGRGEKKRKERGEKEETINMSIVFLPLKDSSCLQLCNTPHQHETTDLRTQRSSGGVS